MKWLRRSDKFDTTKTYFFTTTMTFKGFSGGESIDTHPEVERATTNIIIQLMHNDDLPTVSPTPAQVIDEIVVPAQVESDYSQHRARLEGSEAQTTKQRQVRISDDTNRKTRLSDEEKKEQQIQG
jgi:hypothetical protein